jgi:hypothetical protein
MPSEKELMNKLMCCISMKFNAGIAIFTVFLWSMATFFSYYNKNFDMLSTITNYTSFLSIGCIVGAFISSRAGAAQVASVAIISFMLSMVTVVLAKNTTFSSLGHFWLLPVNIFVSLLLIKNIWLVVSGSEEKSTKAKKG